MSEKPKSTAAETTSSEVPKSPEAPKTTEIKYSSAEEFIKAQIELREKATGEKKSNLDANWLLLGGADVEAALAKVEANPDDAGAQKEFKLASERAHEAYRNHTNEFRHASKEDLADAKKIIADEIKDFRKETYYQQVAELRQELMSDGGITRSQADKLINEATAASHETDKPKAGEAPTSLPTSAEVAAAAATVEEDEPRARGVRRAWDFLNVKTGNGMYHVGEFLTRKNAEGTKRKPGETDEAYEKRMKRKGTITSIGTAAVVGGLLAWRYAAMKNGMDTDAFEGPIVNGEVGTGELGQGSLGPMIPEMSGDATAGTLDDAQHGMTDMLLEPFADEKVDTAAGTESTPETAELGGVDMFEGTMLDGYNPAEDAFNQPGKTGVHNWGVPIPTELAEGAHFEVAGVDELINQSWATSPEQLAAVAAERGLDGFSEMNIEEMAAQMKDNPSFALDTYTEMLEFLNADDTVIREGAPLEPGTYGSYYETMIDGEGVISYDHVVNEPGTVIEIEYTGSDGERHILELKRECGGQVIHRIPVEESVPQGGAQSGNNPVVYQPEYIPQGNGTSPAETVTTPTGGGTPPGEVTPPPYVPEVPVVPEVPIVPELTPKNPALDINANPDLPEQLQMGDQAGTITSGELVTDSVTPPEVYVPPIFSDVSTEVADGAVVNDRTNIETPVVAIPEVEVGLSPEPVVSGTEAAPGATENVGRVEG